MWRAFFLAMGISACIFGAECLVVDHFVMADLPRPQQQVPAVNNSLFGQSTAIAAMKQPIRTKRPPEWAPWTLMSTGAIVILYSITMNRQ